jgi:NADH dehydrogenase
LSCCKALIDAEVEVILVDKQNHHLFQPLLYQVATAGLSLPEIAQPIRTILRPRDGFTVLMEEVTGVDLAAREVVLRGQRLGYDFLVIALGAVTSYFGHPEWARHAAGLKSLDDAARIRREVLLAFERAETSEDAEERRRLMTLVVIGGGPTGVEMAGALAELAKVVLRRDFQRIDPTQAHIVLIEAGPKILGQFDDPLPAKARKQLEALGVEVRTNTPVRDIQNGAVFLDGEVLRAGNIIWAAGVMAHPITKTLGVPLDRAGRIQVLPDCTLPGHPEVFAVGDIVALVDTRGKVVPGVSPAAIQMGQHVAQCIRNDLMHAGALPHPPFTYWDKGSMATIGRSAAIAQVGDWKLSGWLAWVMWLFVHLVFLVGFRNKVAVLVQWAYSYLRYKRGARIISGWEQAGSGAEERKP